MSKDDDMEKTEYTGSTESDEHFELLMQGVGKRPEIPVGAREKSELHFKAELARVRATRTRYRRPAQYAIAAAIVLSSLVLLNQFREQPQGDVVVGVISESIGDGYWQNNGTERPLAIGNQLSIGDSFSTSSGYARLSLLNGTVDLRVGQESKLTFTGADTIYLKQGSIYVDAGDDNHSRFVVTTRYGNVEHVGTQYMVTSSPTLVSIAVREGEIRYQGKSGSVTSRVSGTNAELIRINQDGLDSRRSIPTSGEHWHWVNKVSPEFSTQGKSLIAILNWAARETGRQVTFTTDEIRRQVEAETNPFEGNVPFNPRDRQLNQFIRDTVKLSGSFIVTELDDSHVVLGRH